MNKKQKIKKINNTVVGSRFCIKCDFEIKPIWPDYHDNLENSTWKGGIVDRIAAGYGSVLDGNMYIIAICDNCIKNNKHKLQHIGNYTENVYQQERNKQITHNDKKIQQKTQ